jgi:hypothetical protein
MAVDIPSGLTHINTRARRAISLAISGGWLRQIFNELRKVGADVGRVNSRLNCSHTKEGIPVWAGTYEHDAIVKKQGFKADDIRFGRSNRSKIYAETILDKAGKIHERDWTQGFLEKEQGEHGPAQALGPRAGCMHQLYIAIRKEEGANYRHVGTITVGFRKKPNRKKVDPIMKRWAHEDKGSKYVKYLKDTFNLGGPVFPK